MLRSTIKNIEQAIKLFEKALSIAPDSVDLNSYLAVWQRFKGNKAKSKSYMEKVAKLNSGRENDLKRIFKTIDRVVATPLKAKQILIKENSSRHTILLFILYNNKLISKPFLINHLPEYQ